MSYIKNPKIDGSGIVACIPQTGDCPYNCPDCFFQSGRSYLEPLKENLPNLPNPQGFTHQIVRVNDGNDSSHHKEDVLHATRIYKHKFFNTSKVTDLEGFNDPVVLTVNPGKNTDRKAHFLDVIPKNLMYVRFRTNTWNLELAREVIAYYNMRDVPVVLTFLAYFDEAVPKEHVANYMFRKRTLNAYWAITTDAWREVIREFEDNLLVSSCGKIEGERGKTSCRYCGVCLREYFATMERLYPWKG